MQRKFTTPTCILPMRRNVALLIGLRPRPEWVFNVWAILSPAKKFSSIARRFVLLEQALFIVIIASILIIDA